MPLPESTSGPTNPTESDPESTDGDTTDDEDTVVVEPVQEPEPAKYAMQPYRKLTVKQFKKVHADLCSGGSANIGGHRLAGDGIGYHTGKFEPSKKSTAKPVQFMLMWEVRAAKGRPAKITGRQITAAKATSMNIVVAGVVDRLDITPSAMDAYQEGDKTKVDYRVKLKLAGPGCPGFDTEVHKPLAEDLGMLIDACNEGLAKEIAHGFIIGTTKRGAKESSFQKHFENAKVGEDPDKMEAYLNDFRETDENNTLRHYGKVNRDEKTGDILSIVSPSFNCRALDMNFNKGLTPRSGEVLKYGDQLEYDRIVKWAKAQPDADEQMKHLDVMRDTILESGLLTEKHQSFGLPKFSIGKHPITITEAMQLNAKGALIMVTLESLPLKETEIAGALQYTNFFKITHICFVMEGPDLAAEMGSAVDNDALFASFDDEEESAGPADGTVVAAAVVDGGSAMAVEPTVVDGGSSDSAIPNDVDGAAKPVVESTVKSTDKPVVDAATEARRAARRDKKKAKRTAVDTGDGAKPEKKSKIDQPPHNPQ
jgi:hypothetical protein